MTASMTPAQMTEALKQYEETAAADLATQLAGFQELVGQYGVAYAMKFCAERLSEAEWELNLKQQMSRCYAATSSDLEMWQLVREESLKQLCDCTQTGNLFTVADTAARRRVAARWLRTAEERLAALTA
jgi:chromosome condensin MukBEF ATPase and DNA-binding subunit MukB